MGGIRYWRGECRVSGSQVVSDVRALAAQVNDGLQEVAPRAAGNALSWKEPAQMQDKMDDPQ